MTAEINSLIRATNRAIAKIGKGVRAKMHYVIPKFLGGHADGYLKKLSQHTHREFRVLLARRLKWEFGPETPVTVKFWAKKMARPCLTDHPGRGGGGSVG